MFYVYDSYYIEAFYHYIICIINSDREHKSIVSLLPLSLLSSSSSSSLLLADKLKCLMISLKWTLTVVMRWKLNSQYNTSYTMGCAIILTYCFCDQRFKHYNIIFNRCDEQLNVLILFYKNTGAE